jgi:hypothetical protein
MRGSLVLALIVLCVLPFVMFALGFVLGSRHADWKWEQFARKQGWE